MFNDRAAVHQNIHAGDTSVDLHDGEINRYKRFDPKLRDAMQAPTSEKPWSQSVKLRQRNLGS
jgi:hypothetical protein